MLGACAPTSSGATGDETTAGSSEGNTGTQGSGAGSFGSGTISGGDGHPCAPLDLPGDFAVLERTGESQFKAHSLASWGGNDPTALVGDYDGNGDPDLFIYGFAVADAMMLSGVDDAPVEIEGTDDGIQIAGLGDVDGDGADDIVADVIYDGYGVIRVGPNGPEVTTDIPESLGPLAVAGDLDGDGHVDLVGGHLSDYTIHWGNGTLQPDIGPSFGLPDDTCGHQRAVLVVPREGMSPAVVVGTGKLNPDCLKGVFIAFPEGREIPPTMEVLEEHKHLHMAAALDWNEDGHVDIAYGTTRGEVRVALADGAGGFAPFVEELLVDGIVEGVARDADGRMQVAVTQVVGCVDENGGRSEQWLALAVRPPGGDFGDQEVVGPQNTVGGFMTFTSGLFGSPPGMLLDRIEAVGE